MRQLLHPVAAFVYCNRQAAGRRRQAKDGNFHATAGACATEGALNSTQLKLKYFISFHTWFHLKTKH